MNQAEFYLYDAERGWKDTIGVRDGRFSYESMLRDTATLVLLFPNFSEMPIFARPGITVKMEGDASHLRETSVKGSDENEQMTAFRLRANQLTPPEVLQAARQFIEEQPASPVSLYLLQHYFLLSPTPDYASAHQLCGLMRQALPDDGHLLRLEKQLAALKQAPLHGKLPKFSGTDTQGRTVTNSQLAARANVVCLWATWHYDSRNLLHELRRLQKAHPGQLSVLTISVDASAAECADFLRRDSMTWSNVCDGAMWQTPLAQQFGFMTLPSNLVADDQGRIVARNLRTADDLKKEVEKLLDK